MLPIIIKKAKIKNLIGIINNPTYEDLLFEIAQFLTQENRLDGEFKTREVSLKTRVRISTELDDDINKLVELGYAEKLKYSSYKLIKHLWE